MKKDISQEIRDMRGGGAQTDQWKDIERERQRESHNLSIRLTDWAKAVWLST